MTTRRKPQPPAAQTSTQRQRKRVTKLDAAAQAAGWASWSEYSTAVINGAVSIAPKQ